LIVTCLVSKNKYRKNETYERTKEENNITYDD